ncbi:MULTISPECIES: hypothetical protein [Arenibacter]|uniref:hypothetical protein n=1 Tax=Arenibacter TaxID=178469 RepID=UPI0011AF9CCE|nr:MULTISPECIES: hypothetical protein [Arenibacter]
MNKTSNVKRIVPAFHLVHTQFSGMILENTVVLVNEQARQYKQKKPPKMESLSSVLVGPNLHPEKSTKTTLPQFALRHNTTGQR